MLHGMTFYTYFHTRNDTGAVFYVGKGQDKTRRAHDIGRNAHWNNLVTKCGHTVHIGSYWPTEVEAFDHEKFLILCFKDMGIPLTNMTDGGEGTSGWIPSDQQRAKMSSSHKGVLRGPQSSEHRAKIGASRKGVPLSDAQRAKLSASHKGISYGPTSDATKAKISAAKKGVPLGPMTDATKAKISASLKGMTYGPLSDAHKAKISVASKGVSHGPHSDAAKAKMIASWVLRKEKSILAKEEA